MVGQVWGADMMPWILHLYALPTGCRELNGSSLLLSAHCGRQIWKMEKNKFFPSEIVDVGYLITEMIKLIQVWYLLAFQFSQQFCLYKMVSVGSGSVYLTLTEL